MKIRIEKHVGYYLSLFAVLFLGVFSVMQLSYDRTFQIVALFFLVSFYVILGIVHHLIHHNLTIKIVVEYVLMGIVGMAIVLFVMTGGK